MKKILPSENIGLLQSVVGSEIINIQRQLYENDKYMDEYEQNADGPFQIIFNNGIILHFIAMTELNSIGVAQGTMPVYGKSYILKDVSYNDFWKDRIGQPVQIINILKSDYSSEDNPIEFGIEFIFEFGLKACIEYLDEENYPDTIRVIKEYNGKNYKQIAIT